MPVLIGTTPGTSLIWGPPTWTASWQKSAWYHFAPNICLTIVQIFGNSKIAHRDLVPGNRSRGQRNCLLPGRACIGILKHVLLLKRKIWRDYFPLFSFAFGFSWRHRESFASVLTAEVRDVAGGFPSWQVVPWGHFTYLATKIMLCIYFEIWGMSRIRKQSFPGYLLKKKVGKGSNTPPSFLFSVMKLLPSSSLWSDLSGNTGQSFNSISDRRLKDSFLWRKAERFGTAQLREEMTSRDPFQLELSCDSATCQCNCRVKVELG